ncbi:MAG: response regulator transcription factor [Planctomycetia bacterium]|nr:response regulator transcription factor [Planctomycetia bacterium]
MEIRVLVVDPQEIFRAGLKSLLADTGIRVVGETADVEEAKWLAEKTLPHILLLELENSALDTLDFLYHFRLSFPQVRVVVCTHSDNPTYMLRSAALGVKDYIPKTLSAKSLQSTLQNVYYGTNISENPHWTYLLNSRHARSRSASTTLTKREEQVLRLIVLGQSNKEIAKTLHLSADTVKEHIHHLFQKISVRDRTQAAVWAVRKGFA